MPTITAKAVEPVVMTFSNCSCHPLPGAKLSLSSQISGPAALASGDARSRRFNSYAVCVSTHEWLRNRIGCSDIAIAPKSKIRLHPPLSTRASPGVTFITPTIRQKSFARCDLPHAAQAPPEIKWLLKLNAETKSCAIYSDHHLCRKGCLISER